MAKGKLKGWVAELRSILPGKGKAGAAAAGPLQAKRDEFDATMARLRREAELFQTLPYAEARPLDDILNRASIAAAKGGEQGSEKDFESALSILREFGSRMKGQQAAQKKAANDALAQEALKPAVQEKLAGAEALVADLRANHAGIDDALARMDAVIAETQGFAKAGRWSDAKAELAKLDKLPSRQQCIKDSEAAQAKVKAKVPALAVAQQVVGDLEKLLSGSAFASLKQEFVALQRRLLAPVSDPQVLGELDRFAKASAVRLAEVGRSREASQNKLAELRKNQLPRATTVAPDRESVRLADKVNLAEGALASKDYGQAAELLRTVEAELDAAFARHRKFAQDWERASGEWTTVVGRLKTLGQDKEVPAAEAQNARGLAGLDGQRVKRIGERDWEWLIESLHRMRQGAEQVEAAKKRYAAFAAEREAAAKKVSAASVQVSTAIQGLRKKLTAAKLDVAAACAPLEARQNAIKAAWEARRTNACDTIALDAGGAIIQLEALRADVLRAGEPQALESTRGAQEAEQARRQFGQVRAQIEGKLTALEVSDRTLAGKLRAQVEKAEAGAGSDWAQGVAALEALGREVDAATQKAQGSRAERVRDAMARCDTVGKAIDTAWATVKKSGEKQFKPAFDAFREELAALRELAGSENADAARTAIRALPDLQLRVSKMKSDADLDRFPLADLLRQHEEFESRLEAARPRVEADAARAWAALRAEADEFREELYGLEPAAAVQRMRSMLATLKDVEADAASVAALRKTVDDMLPLLKAELGLLDEAGSAPAYAKQLRERFESARALGKQPDKLFQAKSQLDALHRELDDALRNPDRAVERQAAQLAAEEADKRARIEWKARLALFERKQFPRARAAVDEQDGDRAQLAEIERMLKVARDAAEGDDTAGALRQLELCVTRVEQVVRDPEGPALGSRNALPKNADRYRDAVQALVRALDDFPALVEKKVPEANPAVKAKVSALVGDVRNRLDAGAFDLAAARISDREVTAGERRALREEALSRARATRTLLQGHPSLAKLRRNPVASLEPKVAFVEKCLTQLEANIRRAVQ